MPALESVITAKVLLRTSPRSCWNADKLCLIQIREGVSPLPNIQEFLLSAEEISIPGIVEQAHPLAASISDPPPIAMTVSGPNERMISVPPKTVSVDGSGSTSTKV